MMFIKSFPALIWILYGLIPLQVWAQDTIRITLSQADSMFLQENYLLLAGQYNISIQEAMEKQVRLYPNPEFTGAFTLIDPENNRYFHAGKTGQKEISLEQIILMGGKRRTEIAIAKEDTRLAEYAFTDLLRNLKYSLHTNYYQLLKYQIELNRYHAQLSLLDTIIRSYEQQAKQGNIPIKEVVRLKSVYMSLSNDKAEVARQYTECQTALRILLNTDKLIVPITDEDRLRACSHLISLDSLSEVALNSRPEIFMSSLEGYRAMLNLKLERKKNIPDISVFAAYDQRGGAFNNQVNAGLRMNLPVWNRNRGNIEAARIQQKIVENMRLHTEQVIYSEALQAWENMKRSLSEYEIANQMYSDDFTIVFRGITENFQKRNISLIEFVDFIESYNISLTEFQRTITQVLTSAEEINYVSGIKLY